MFQQNNSKISCSQLSYTRKDLCRNLRFFSFLWIFNLFSFSTEYLCLDDCFWNSQSIFSMNIFFLWINLFCSIAHDWCPIFLKLWYWCAEKYFLLSPAKLFPVTEVSLIWYFLIGNIFVQSWLIWATFHTTNDYQKFLLLGYDLKNILTLSKNGEAALRRCSSK